MITEGFGCCEPRKSPRSWKQGSEARREWVAAAAPRSQVIGSPRAGSPGLGRAASPRISPPAPAGLPAGSPTGAPDQVADGDRLRGRLRPAGQVASWIDTP